MSDTVIVKIDKFNPRKLPDEGVIAFIGRTASGKSFCMNDILYHKRHFQRVIAYCGSEDTSAELRKKVPDMLIHDEWDEKLITDIYDKQERQVRLGTAKHLLIIVDDMMHHKDLLKCSHTMQRIFFNGRHAKILLLLSMQYCKNLGPDMRQQISYTFLSFEKLPVNRRILYDTFNNVFSSYNEFDGVFKTLTQNYTVLVLSNAFSFSDAIDANVFWYKAKRHNHYRIGKHSAIWKCQKRKYDPLYFMRGHMNELGDGPTITEVIRPHTRISNVIVQKVDESIPSPRRRKHRHHRHRH